MGCSDETVLIFSGQKSFAVKMHQESMSSPCYD